MTGMDKPVPVVVVVGIPVPRRPLDNETMAYGEVPWAFQDEIEQIVIALVADESEMHRDQVREEVVLRI